MIVKSDQTPYYNINEIRTQMRYPAGETHSELNDIQGINSIAVEAEITNFEELCDMIVTDEILKRQGIQTQWFVPYFPFARHDRRNHNKDGYELGLAKQLVQSLNITIADPHSDVTGEIQNISQTEIVNILIQKGHIKKTNLTAVIPDAGASKKAYDWSIPNGIPTVQATKRRDPKTGKLSGFGVPETDLIEGKDIIIVDDICDGGGTFLGLAEKILEKNPKTLTLVVTHGLFTKGFDALAKSYDQIITFGYKNKQNDYPEFVEVVPFQTIYEQGEKI